MIDEGISMADLKGTLGLFAHAMFGGDVSRLVPKAVHDRLLAHRAAQSGGTP